MLASMAVLGLLLPCRARPSEAARKPKLVVVLVADQMRADYVDLYGKSWRGGLARLFTQGAYFTNASYPYLQTITCAGHATVSTGAYPHIHGLIQNAWFDRATAKNVSCTDDPSQPLVTYSVPIAGGESPHRLLVSTLADEMREQLRPSPRVVSFSLKARSAIMLAGHKATSVAWTDAGALVTSKAFSPVPVLAIAQHLARFPVNWDKVPAWTKSSPPSAYAFTDEGLAEYPPKGWTPSFPHKLQGSTQLETMANWTRSPLADDYFAHMALQTVKSMKLGQTPATDYLAISFSVLDLVGHAYGPRSHEVQDVLLRLDKSLGRLFAGLDGAVGKNNYVVVLTADHGVAPLPEQMTQEGQNAGRIDIPRVAAALEAATVKEIGGKNNVVAAVYTDLYLAPGAYQKVLGKPGAIERVLAALKTQPGVADAFHAQQLANPRVAQSDLQKAAALSFYPGRSGDFVLVPAPFWLAAAAGTTHGSANDYDKRVPVVFMGAGIKKGKLAVAASPADVAPTLAKIVGVTMKSAQGHVLNEALIPSVRLFGAP